MSASRFPFASRLASVRAAMKDALLDGLVVTHSPNVQYLCTFIGSSGALVVERERFGLVVDFRYVTSAREIPRLHPDLEALEIILAERNEDEAVVARLTAGGCQRIGIEASWMPVARFNRLSAAIAAKRSHAAQRRKAMSGPGQHGADGGACPDGQRRGRGGPDSDSGSDALARRTGNAAGIVATRTARDGNCWRHRRGTARRRIPAAGLRDYRGVGPE